MKALVIEDDQDVANYLVKGLKESDFVVDHAADGKEGMMMAASEAYDLMIGILYTSDAADERRRGGAG